MDTCQFRYAPALFDLHGHALRKDASERVKAKGKEVVLIAALSARQPPHEPRPCARPRRTRGRVKWRAQHGTPRRMSSSPSSAVRCGVCTEEATKVRARFAHRGVCGYWPLRAMIVSHDRCPAAPQQLARCDPATRNARNKPFVLTHAARLASRSHAVLAHLYHSHSFTRGLTRPSDSTALAPCALNQSRRAAPVPAAPAPCSPAHGQATPWSASAAPEEQSRSGISPNVSKIAGGEAQVESDFRIQHGE